MKILVLEDDQLVARGLSRILGLMGHEVVLAHGVGDAKSLTAKHQDLAVAMADLGLPGGESGLDYLGWLAGAHNGVRRVLLTGMRSPVNFADDPPRQLILLKPFDQRRLQEALARLVNPQEATS